MLDLASIKEIVATLSWLLTLGASEIKHVKFQTEELIHHLSASLVSLWDVTLQVTRLTEQDFSRQNFESISDYFFRFYLDPANISKARTHCGEVARDIDRILFKLTTILRTDIGKWDEAKKNFDKIVYDDGKILSSFQRSIDTLKAELEAVRDKLNAGDIDAAKHLYFGLKGKLTADITKMNASVKVMQQALEHVRRVVS